MSDDEPRPRRTYRPISDNARMRQMLQTRSHSWREVGLARELSRKAVRRARVQLLVLAPLLAGVLLLYAYRRDIFGRSLDTPVRVLTVVALMALGWQFARDIGRSAGRSPRWSSASPRSRRSAT